MNIDVTARELNREVKHNQKLLLVYFKNDWNGACQIIAPVLDELSAFYRDKAKFITVDAERNKSAIHDYGVMEIPTILFFMRQEVVDYVSGLASKKIIAAKIENALTSTNN